VNDSGQSDVALGCGSVDRFSLPSRGSWAGAPADTVDPVDTIGKCSVVSDGGRENSARRDLQKRCVGNVLGFRLCKLRVFGASRGF